VSRGPDSYPWPVRPFGVQHPIRGYFGDPRTIFRTSDDADLGAFSFHNGVDIVASDGTPVYPVVSGVVTRVMRDEIVVVSDGGARTFQYWHLRARVRVNEPVRAERTVLGTVQSGRGHVHLTEIDGSVVENPLQPGHLTPYRDRTPPTVESVLFRDQLGRALNPDALHGLVDIAARAVDTPPLPIPAPWSGVPVTPARVSWQLSTLDGRVLLPEQTTADFLTTIPTPDLFWSVYEPGTYQNFPVVGRRYLFGTPGDYLFDLTPSRLDTRLLPPGPYKLTVVAEDTCGNQGTLSQQIRVVPQPELSPLVVSAPAQRAQAGLTILPSRPAHLWTVITATVRVGDGLSRAEAAARENLEAGLPDVGILTTVRSRDRVHGDYLVFTGAYRSWISAYPAAQLASQRFPGAHVREILRPRHARRSRSRPGPALTPNRLGRYTVILASIPVHAGQAGAHSLALNATAHGLPSVRLLITSRFASLRPGYVVVVSGRYPTRKTAIRAAARVRRLYPGAYPRLLIAREHNHH
jgi:Peptidase family M23